MRLGRGWSQAHLGRCVFVSGDLIGKIEKAIRRPTPDLVDRLDDVLHAQGELIRARDRFPTPDTSSQRSPDQPGT